MTTLKSSIESTKHVALHNMPSVTGARHKRKRLGRGKGSGYGGTSTKGHKGQKARAGFGLLRGFEGGQMPLVRRLPKFGFTNKQFKVNYEIVNLSGLNRFTSGKEVGPLELKAKGLVRKKTSLIKILGKGKLDKSLNVKANKFSKKAVSMIQKAGGQATTIVTKEAGKKQP